MTKKPRPSPSVIDHVHEVQDCLVEVLCAIEDEEPAARQLRDAAHRLAAVVGRAESAQAALTRTAATYTGRTLRVAS